MRDVFYKLSCANLGTLGGTVWEGLGVWSCWRKYVIGGVI